MKKVILGILLISILTAAEGQTFVDRAEDYGIAYSYDVCLLAAGIAFTDFDGDGIDDLLMPTCGGAPNIAYKGTGSGFDLYSISAWSDDLGDSKSIYAVDLDNDGDRELFVCNINGPNILYWNHGADGYEDVSEAAGINFNSYDSFAACFGDYDRDGFLDIYVGNRSTPLEPMPNFLYHNNGDGTFTNMAGEAGVVNSIGAALAVGFVDINNDLWPDIYIANDKLTGNKMYKNVGDGTFEDISDASGTAVEMDGMSVSLCDYNQDGFLDIYTSNTQISGNKFHINNGDETFEEVAEELGVLVDKWCWGSVFIDYDLDGDEDLYVASMMPPVTNENTFFLLYEGQFIPWSDEVIPIFIANSMGAAKADYDQDGDYDLAVLAGYGNNTEILENTNEDNNYIAFTLEGVQSNHEGVGVHVHVEVEGESQYFQTTLGGNFASQNGKRQIVGIGEAESANLTLLWPSGIEMQIDNLEANTYTHIVESKPTELLEKEVELVCFPNPVRDQLRLSGANFDRVELHDLSGREVFKKEWISSQENVVLDMKSIAKGIYLLRISRDGQGIFSQKIIRI